MFRRRAGSNDILIMKTVSESGGGGGGARSHTHTRTHTQETRQNIRVLPAAINQRGNPNLHAVTASAAAGRLLHSRDARVYTHAQHTVCVYRYTSCVASTENDLWRTDGRTKCFWDLFGGFVCRAGAKRFVSPRSTTANGWDLLPDTFGLGDLKKKTKRLATHHTSIRM